MTQVRALISRVDRFVKRSGLAPSTVSRKVFLDGKRLDELKAGKSRMFSETVAEASKRLDELEAELSPTERLRA